MKKWKKFLENKIDPTKYKLWDMDTRWDGILDIFRKNVSKIDMKNVNQIHVKSFKKDEKWRWKIFINDTNVTPISRGDDASSGALRQYLQVLDMVSIISYTGLTLKDGNDYSFDMLNTEFVHTSSSELIFEAGKNILIKGLHSPRPYIKNAWLSLVLSMLNEIDANFIDELNISYYKAKRRLDQKTSDVVKEIKYTYEGFYKGDLLRYFNRYCETEIIEQVSGEKQTHENRDEITTYIIDQVARRRAKISEQIRVIRNYKNDSDIDGISVPLNLLDAAHIKSVSSIKQDALIEASLASPNMNKINNILDQINNPNNILLIPHNYHYLLDKGYLVLSNTGEFILSLANEKIYKEFGVKSNAKIKNGLLTKELTHFIHRQ